LIIQNFFKKVDALIKSQKGALNRFIKIDKNKIENISNCSLNEQVNNIEIDENENKEEILVNEHVNNVIIDENKDNEQELLFNEQDYIDYQTQNEKKLIN